MEAEIPSPKEGEYLVCYFEDGSYNFIPEDDAMPFHPHRPPYTTYVSGPDGAQFKEDHAVSLATRYWETGEAPDSFHWLHWKKKEELAVLGGASVQAGSDHSKKRSASNLSGSTANGQTSKKVKSFSVTSGSEAPTKKAKKDDPSDSNIARKGSSPVPYNNSNSNHFKNSKQDQHTSSVSNSASTKSHKSHSATHSSKSINNHNQHPTLSTPRPSSPHGSSYQNGSSYPGSRSLSPSAHLPPPKKFAMSASNATSSTPSSYDPRVAIPTTSSGSIPPHHHLHNHPPPPVIIPKWERPAGGLKMLNGVFPQSSKKRWLDRWNSECKSSSPSPLGCAPPMVPLEQTPAPSSPSLSSFPPSQPSSSIRNPPPTLKTESHGNPVDGYLSPPVEQQHPMPSAAVSDDTNSVKPIVNPMSISDIKADTDNSNCHQMNVDEPNIKLEEADLGKSVVVVDGSSIPGGGVKREEGQPMGKGISAILMDSKMAETKQEPTPSPPPPPSSSLERGDVVPVAGVESAVEEVLGSSNSA
ncbi:hypothetical protein HDV05_000308 [Chytridiales sp. JEL 0842]|nr:hypothetical protein HDV05_000308 [Chytridiales sp. JEL 0842]